MNTGSGLGAGSPNEIVHHSGEDGTDSIHVSLQSWPWFAINIYLLAFSCHYFHSNTSDLSQKKTFFENCDDVRARVLLYASNFQFKFPPGQVLLS